MEYRNPKPTVDIVICLDEVSDTLPRIVLIKRQPPKAIPGLINPAIALWAGREWALPGGYVNEGETLEAAAIREAKEETGLDVELTEQFFTYSDPKRDPRQHNMSTVFIGRAVGYPKAGDDAAGADVVSIENACGYDLAFDHQLILLDVFRYLKTGERRKLTRKI